jgi:hypothetical protein
LHPCVKKDYLQSLVEIEEDEDKPDALIFFSAFLDSFPYPVIETLSAASSSLSSAGCSLTPQWAPKKARMASLLRFLSTSSKFREG